MTTADTKNQAELQRILLTAKREALKNIGRYVNIMAEISTGDYPEAEELNKQLQAAIDSGEKLTKEDLLARLEAMEEALISCNAAERE